MKAITIKTLFVAMILVLMSGCTRNNGDIGELFGQWRVTSIAVDGEEVQDYDGTLYFAFQSSVYCQKKVNEFTHESDGRYAAWRYEGSGIMVDFSEERYAPFIITGMQMGQNYLEIELSKGDDLVFSYVNPEGVKYVYVLKKW